MSNYVSFKSIQQFLDVEAGVNSTNEDEDELDLGHDLDEDVGDDWEDTRLEKGSNDLFEPEEDSLEDGRPRNLLNDHQASVDDAEERVSHILQRHRQSHRAANVHHDGQIVDASHLDSDWEEAILSMPSVYDPDIWRVRVRHGEEEETVFSLFNTCIRIGSSVACIFHRPSFPGYVYIEGTYSACLHLLSDYPNIRLRRKQPKSLIELISIDNRIPLLTHSRGSWPIPSPSSFIRIRDRSRYRFDLGFVTELKQSGLIEVLVVPRPRRLHKQRTPRSAPSLRRVGGISSDTVAPALNDSKHIEGLELLYLSPHNVQRTFINPTLREISLFETSPLFKRTNSGDDDMHPKSSSFTKALLRFRETGLSIQPDDIVKIIRGVFKGLLGRVTEVHNTVAVVETRTQLPSFEVPTHFTTYQPSTDPAASVTILDGPYNRLKGTMSQWVDDSHIVVTPSTVDLQQVEVRTWELMHHFDIGDSVRITYGQYVGTHGYVIANELTTVMVYIHSHPELSGKHLAIPQTQLRHSEIAKPLAKSVKTISSKKIQEVDQYRGLEVFIVKHPELKGRLGYIVGHSYKHPSTLPGSNEGLVFEVNVGQNITSFTTQLDPGYLLEKYSRLPILTAAQLPRNILIPPNIPPPRSRTKSPPLRSDTPVDPAWTSTAPGEDELPVQHGPHWLTHLPTDTPVYVVIYGTKESLKQGNVVQTPFYKGRYEGLSATLSLEFPIREENPSVNIFIDGSTNQPFRINYLRPFQESSRLVVGQRVLIIGEDLSHNLAAMGKIGRIHPCLFPLPQDQRLILVDSAQWFYFNLSSLCLLA
ncbi:hypothetical protein ONZ45_g5229 [Pleurotus djamor]|nr:hypothetical protein ONZ45_g5229 [Pleurotus djamor]